MIMCLKCIAWALRLVSPWLVHQLVRGSSNGIQVDLIHCLKGGSYPVPQGGGGVGGGTFHLVELNLKLLHLTPELSLLVRSSCHHLPAQANHALEHPLDTLRQVLVLDGLSLELLLQVGELLAQLLQTLLVGNLVDLVCSLEEPLHHLCHGVHVDVRFGDHFFFDVVVQIICNISALLPCLVDVRVD